VVVGPQGKTELTKDELKKLAGEESKTSSQMPVLYSETMQAKGRYGLPLFIGILAAPAIALKLRRKR
jgi:hypothetical protein